MEEMRCFWEKRGFPPPLAMTQIPLSPSNAAAVASFHFTFFLCCGRKGKLPAENKHQTKKKLKEEEILPPNCRLLHFLRHFPSIFLRRLLHFHFKMTSLTHPAHHRHQSAHSHGSPPFSAIRFHALELANANPSQSTLAPSSHHPLVFNPLLPSFPCHPPSVLVHAGTQNVHQNHPFGPFAAAFAGSLLGPSLIGGGSAFGILPMANGRSESGGNSVIEFGQSKDPILAENSPPQLSITSISSASFGADSDGLSCSSSSGPNSAQANAAQNQEGQPMDRQEEEQEGQKEAMDQRKLGVKKQLVRDETYWERRRKNNDAAKRSRDSRRKKEDEVAVRAVILEQENLRLRFELERLRTEIERHRIVAFSQGMAQQQQQEGGSKFGEQIGIGNAPSAAAFLCPNHPMALAAAAAAAAAMVNERNGQQNLALLGQDSAKIVQTNGTEMGGGAIVSSSTSI